MTMLTRRAALTGDIAATVAGDSLASSPARAAAPVAGRQVPGVFFFNDTATTKIYTLSLHDAFPVYICGFQNKDLRRRIKGKNTGQVSRLMKRRSEEHTSELQSQSNLVCRLLLE